MAAVPVQDQLDYTLALVSDLANNYSLPTPQAFNCLGRFKAIELVEQHYDIARTLACSEMVDTLASYCKDHGGNV